MPARKPVALTRGPQDRRLEAFDPRDLEVTAVVSESEPTFDGLAIRPARAADSDAVWALLADLAGSIGLAHKFHGSAEDLRRHGFAGTRHFEALIAEVEGIAVGLVLYFFNYSTWRGRLGVYVQDIHVVEAYRSKGLGRQLLAAAAARGRAQGCTHLRLSVDPGNETARRFYERVGLEERSDEAIYQVSDERFHSLAEAGR